MTTTAVQRSAGSPIRATKFRLSDPVDRRRLAAYAELQRLHVEEVAVVQREWRGLERRLGLTALAVEVGIAPLQPGHAGRWRPTTATAGRIDLATALFQIRSTSFDVDPVDVTADPAGHQRLVRDLLVHEAAHALADASRRDPDPEHGEVFMAAAMELTVRGRLEGLVLPSPDWRLAEAWPLAQRREGFYGAAAPRWDRSGWGRVLLARWRASFGEVDGVEGVAS